MDREVRTVLVVDGSASLLFYIGLLLKRLEYRVMTARTAEEALGIIADVIPSIVLTDLALPTMNGINLLKRIKETPALQDISVVILTAESDPGVRDTCMRMGCTAYLAKPVDPESLFRTLQAASESVPRKNIRLRTSLKVIVGDGSVLGGSKRTEYATAISEDGLYVRTLYPQPRNAVTPLSIFLHDREVRAKAVVLYTHDLDEGPFKEPGMGMRFTEMTDADRALVRQFIREQLTQDMHGQG
jgi:CheY-like chemotaxis protein